MSARDELQGIIELRLIDDFTSSAASAAGAVAGVGGALFTHHAIMERGGYNAVRKKGVNVVKDSISKITKKASGFRLSSREQLNAIIHFKAVDLGYSYDSYPCAAGDSESKKHYPSLYISDRDNEIDLPLSGTAKVKFKLRSKTTRQDDAGKKRHSADIEIQSIDPIEEEAKPVEGGKAKPLKLSWLPENRSVSELTFLNTANVRLSAREELESIIEFARGDYLLKRMAQAGGKIEMPLEQTKAIVKAAKGDTLGYMAEAKRIGGVDGSVQNARNFLAGQVKSQRAAGRASGVGSYWDSAKPASSGYQASGASILAEKIKRRISAGVSDLIGGARSAIGRIGQWGGAPAQGYSYAAQLRDIIELSKRRITKRGQRQNLVPNDEGPATMLSYRKQLDLITLGSDPRPRNQLGMFQGGAQMEPGTNPNAIHQAYKLPQAMEQEAAMAGAARKIIKRIRK